MRLEKYFHLSEEWALKRFVSNAAKNERNDMEYIAWNYLEE